MAEGHMSRCHNSTINQDIHERQRDTEEEQKKKEKKKGRKKKTLHEHNALYIASSPNRGDRFRRPQMHWGQPRGTHFKVGASNPPALCITLIKRTRQRLIFSSTYSYVHRQ